MRVICAMTYGFVGVLVEQGSLRNATAVVNEAETISVTKPCSEAHAVLVARNMITAKCEVLLRESLETWPSATAATLRSLASIISFSFQVLSNG